MYFAFAVIRSTSLYQPFMDLMYPYIVINVELTWHKQSYIIAADTTSKCIRMVMTYVLHVMINCYTTNCKRYTHQYRHIICRVVNHAHHDTDTIQCDRVVRLINCLAIYDQSNMNQGRMDTQFASNVIDDFLHTIYEHNQDEEFAAIYNVLKHCDVTQCAVFSDRNSNKRGAYGIISKIHCYYHHSYDIGNRLTMKEIAQLQYKSYNAPVRYNCNDNYEYLDDHIIKSKISQVYQAIRSRPLVNAVRNRMAKKYHQLPSNSDGFLKDNLRINCITLDTHLNTIIHRN
eukprot:1110165_1